MAGIIDGIIAIAWIWFYVIVVLACLSTALLVIAILRYRRSQNQIDQARRPDMGDPKTEASNGRSKLTADLL